MQQKTLEKNKNSHKCLESNYLPKTRANFTRAIMGQMFNLMHLFCAKLNTKKQ